jgi:hypothetical protein
MDVRLKDQTGMFHDPETGFSLIAKEVKPLPQNIGQLTRRWLNAGGLVSVASSKPVDSKNIDEAEKVVQSPTAIDNYLAEFDRSELMRLCKERGISTSRKDKAIDLARRLAEVDLET